MNCKSLSKCIIKEKKIFFPQWHCLQRESLTVGNSTIILLLRLTILCGSVSLDTEFGEQNYPPSLVTTQNRGDLWRNLCRSLSYFEVRVRCGKESSRSLSHLLMSFLYLQVVNEDNIYADNVPTRLASAGLPFGSVDAIWWINLNLCLYMNKLLPTDHRLHKSTISYQALYYRYFHFPNPLIL